MTRAVPSLLELAAKAVIRLDEPIVVLPVELHEYLQTTAGVSLTDAANLLTDYLELTRFIAALDSVADEPEVMKQIITRYEQLEKQFGAAVDALETAQRFAKWSSNAQWREYMTKHLADALRQTEEIGESIQINLSMQREQAKPEDTPEGKPEDTEESPMSGVD